MLVMVSDFALARCGKALFTLSIKADEEMNFQNPASFADQSMWQCHHSTAGRCAVNTCQKGLESPLCPAGKRSIVLLCIIVVLKCAGTR